MDVSKHEYKDVPMEDDIVKKDISASEPHTKDGTDISILKHDS